MADRIEKRIELAAPVSRVWRALTDYREFGEWFRVKLDGPFVPGRVSRGYITHPGYEHVKWEAVVQKMKLLIQDVHMAERAGFGQSPPTEHR